ncbi:MAG: sulfatase-like hydrolase/transferase [Planctomycetota bacterium]
MPTSPPNILLIHSDQHRYDCLGLHGHPQLQTPNLDRLAAHGTDFSHAFTPAPICSPARASLMTGRWPSQHRCINIPPFDGYQPAQTDTPVLWNLLHNAGYRQAHFGKYHKELPGLPTDYGVDRYACEERDYERWRAQQRLPRRERQNGWFGEIDPHTTAEQSRIAWGADLTQRAIQDFSAEGSPFFIRWDPSEPHLPCLVPQEIADLYPPETIEPWPSFAEPLNHKPPMQAKQQQAWGVDGWRWQDWAPVVSRYLAEITLLDRYIGRVLDTLKDAGQLENTLVIYTTDHGDLCGGHGMMDKHYMMYDDVVRVPLIISQPGTVPAGRACDEMVIHELDLASTICAAAHVTPPPRV